jgi:hypothetical protein
MAVTREPVRSRVIAPSLGDAHAQMNCRLLRACFSATGDGEEVVSGRVGVLRLDQKAAEPSWKAMLHSVIAYLRIRRRDWGKWCAGGRPGVPASHRWSGARLLALPLGSSVRWGRCGQWDQPMPHPSFPADGGGWAAVEPARARRHRRLEADGFQKQRGSNAGVVCGIATGVTPAVEASWRTDSKRSLTACLNITAAAAWTS